MGRLVSLSIRSLLVSIHFLWPGVRWAFRHALWFTLLALFTMWAGVPRTVRLFAETVTEGAVRSGIPLSFAPILYWIVAGIAFTQIFVGWIILALLTVTAIDLLIWLV
ncbi:MAG: hypothetical protein M1305_02615 [Candidatus Marsarchaeota archaeon]|nr:hypothetical protein [Candidatus Marsarchaeota archaeon]